MAPKWQGTQNDLEAILAAITDGFFVVDKGWRLVYLNEQAEAFWGHINENSERRARLGESIWETFPEVVGSEPYRLYHRAVQEGVPTTTELYVAPCERWFYLSAYPFDGGLSVYIDEITTRKMAGEAMRARNEALEQQNRRLQSELTASRATEEALMQTVQDVVIDAAWLSRAVVGRLVQLRAQKTGDTPDQAEVAVLSPRQRQVLDGMAQGQTNEQIATDLGLAEQTVRNYITHIYKKLAVHSRAEAVVWARERGLVRSPGGQGGP